MKPFDLEAAKHGEPICDRNGNPVRFIAHVPDAEYMGYKVVVLTHLKNIRLHHENGKYATRDCDSDLFMATKKVKREGWINVYPGHPHDCMHPSKEKANKEAAPRRIACVHVEYEFEE